MNGRRWLKGNAIELLENGEQFFPRVFEAIREALPAFRDKLVMVVGQAYPQALAACQASSPRPRASASSAT